MQATDRRLIGQRSLGFFVSAVCVVGATQLHQQVTLQLFTAGQEGFVGVAVEQLEGILGLVLGCQYARQTLTRNLAQGNVGRFVQHAFQLGCGVIELAAVDRDLGHEQAAVLGVSGAAKLALELAGQFRDLGGVRLAGRCQAGFNQRLIQLRGTLRLVGLVLVPGIPAQHHHASQQCTGQQRLAVAVPPVLDPCQVIIIGTRHPNTPFRLFAC
ncbi:hypothetical protein D3C81_1251310 [compost metagenome]